MKKAILALPSCECADLRSSTFSPEPPPLADQSGSPPAVVGAPVQPPVPAVKQGRFRFLFAATGVVGLLVVLVAGWMLQPRPEESTVAAARPPVAPASTLSEPSFSARADAVSTDATPIPASLAETNDARDSSEPATAPRDAGTAHSDTNTAVVAVTGGRACDDVNGKSSTPSLGTAPSGAGSNSKSYRGSSSNSK